MIENKLGSINIPDNLPERQNNGTIEAREPVMMVHAYEEDFANRKRPPSMSNLGDTDSTNIEQIKKASTSKATTIVKTRQQILEERAVKIREARERYFERRGISPQ